MTSDCDLGASARAALHWQIGEGVKITINGNGYSIKGGSGTNYALVRVAVTGELVLNNVGLERVYLHCFGALKAQNAAFAWVGTRALWLDGTADLKEVIFHDNTTGSAGLGSAIVASSVFGKGIATVTNGVFRNNKGTHATNPSHTLFTYHGSYTQTAKITLLNTATFEDNTPSDKNWKDTSNVDDQTGGNTVPPGTVVGPYRVSRVAQPDSRSEDGPSQPGRQSHVPGEACWHRLGIIGLICYSYDDYGKATATILRIDSDSQGHYKLGATQRQIEARLREGLVASSADGRAAVYLLAPACVQRDARGNNPKVTNLECVAGQISRLRDLARQGQQGAHLGWERYISVSKGPNFEGKVHTIVFDNSVDGRVVGIVDVFIGAPGVVERAPVVSAPPPSTPESPWRVIPQAAGPDGAQWHVVQPGETLLGIAIAYGTWTRDLMKVNLLEDADHIEVGRALLIRRG